MRDKSSFWLWVFFVITATRSWALDPSRNLVQYQAQNWQWEQGLPGNSIHTLAQTEDGRLLIGTGKGLVRFDGTRFASIPVDSTDVGSNYPILSLLVARDGALWIGTNHHGLVVQRAGQARTYTTSDGLADDIVQSLYEDEAGAIWISTSSGTCRIASGRVQCLPTGATPGSRMRSNVVDDNLGGVLIAAQTELLDWKRGTTTSVQLFGAKAGEIRTLFRDRNGKIWAGTTKGLFRLYLSGNQATFEAREGVAGPVVGITDDASGNLWISSYGHGLYRWNREHGVEQSAQPNQFVRALLVDRDGSLWIGGWADGLTRWTNSSFVPYGVQEGLSNPFAVSVLEDTRGVLWMAAVDGGLFRFADGHLTQEGVPASLLNESMRAIASGPDGRVWFGTALRGLYSFDGKSLRHWDVRNSPVQRDIRALLVDSSGNLWMGSSEGGVERFQGSVIDTQHQQTFLPHQRVHALIETQPGVILAGSDRGLYQISGGLVMSIPGGGPVLSLSKDAANITWVGLQSGGIDVLENGKLHHFSPAQGIPPATVDAVLDDHRGSLWMATDRGVLRVSRDQMLAVTAGKRRFAESALYGRLDGMRTMECRWEAQPAAWRTSNGDLWFATANGFVRRPAQTVAAQPAPIPIIDGAEVDGVESDATRLVTPPGTRQIDIQFGAIKLSDPQQLQFRYKLEGFDSDWHTETSGRAAHYAALSPGRYQFRLQARSELGPWSSTVASLELLQKPYVYQTWWGRVAGIIVVVLLLWLWSHWYRGRVHGKVAAVVEERNRISREWHDSLMASFAAIVWQLEATGDRLRESPDEARSLLELARDMVRHTQTEARRIIWDLRLNLDERATLSQTLINLCSRLSDTSNVSVTTELHGSEVHLPGVLGHNLLRIAQESLHNAIRHAQPNSIVVKLSFADELVTLRIKDDGCGFIHHESRQVDAGHLGILGMTERARKLGGSLDVQSVPGTGTEVIATFALDGRAA